MKTRLTSALFVTAVLSFLLYSCQKEETVRVATPNKPTVTTPVVVVNNPTPDKPITNNPNTPTPTSPSNPNHPTIDPNGTVANSASCANCHSRIKDVSDGNWTTDQNATPGGLGVEYTNLCTKGMAVKSGK